MQSALSQVRHRSIKKNEPNGSFNSFMVRMTGLVVSKANVIAKRANLFATVERQLHKCRLQTKFADNAICIVASPSPSIKKNEPQWFV